MRPEEIQHFAGTIGAILVTLTRPDITVEARRQLHEALVGELGDAFTLLSHDAFDAQDLVADLLSRPKRNEQVLA